MATTSIRAGVEQMLKSVIERRDELDDLAIALRDVIEKLDALPPEIAASLAPQPPGAASLFASFGNEGEPGRQTQYGRMVEFFVRRGNRPATVKVIGLAIGASRSAVSNVLYRTHKEFFVAHGVHGSERFKEWNLREDVFERAAADRAGKAD